VNRTELDPRPAIDNNAKGYRRGMFLHMYLPPEFLNTRMYTLRYIDQKKHNDLGMATANTVTALKSGATCASATINGIGERAGNAALEEIIVALQLNGDCMPKYETKNISSLCKYVEEISKIALSKNKPITGKNAHIHESGVHVNWIKKNNLSYQAYNESILGVETEKISFGKHSGKSSIEHFFESKNLPGNTYIQQLMLEIIKKESEKTKQSVNESRVMEIYSNLLSAYQNPANTSVVMID
ncbi:MAG: hypothetical protein R6W78_08015, partial [Bacteroidales bacterium]